MKKCFIQPSFTKTTLAVVAAVFMLLGPAPAQAGTSWVRGGNWADDGDNYQAGVIYPTGISNSTTTAQAAGVADAIAGDDISVGINFVRIGINPPTISDNWPVVQAYVNELIKDGLYVDLCYWISTTSVGTVTNLSAWQSMWETVDSVYSGNNMVYYEPINEPYGYSASGLESVYTTFLGFINKSQGNIILDGTGYADDISPIGGDSSFNSCLLGVHDYAFWHTNITTESAWESNLSGEVGGYQSRTIMTEMGAPATTGLDYDTSSNTDYISFIRGMAEQCRAWPMGFAYWPSHRANDSYRLFTSPDGEVTNPSLINELEYGWDFFTAAAVWGICDFNAIGESDYSVYRPSNGKWYISGGAQTVWGTNADIAVPADYAGNGYAQFATWRPSNYTWYVDGVSQTAWGTAGDIPVPADYDGTGQAQLAIWRPSNGNWYINGGAQTAWGTNGDIPVPGYYNGDGHADLATWRPSNGKWYVYGGAQTVWGTNGDIPVPGDYNGSGKTEFAFWRPSNDTWYVYGVGQTNWGTTNDVPLPLPYAIRHYCLGYAH